MKKFVDVWETSQLSIVYDLKLRGVCSLMDPRTKQCEDCSQAMIMIDRESRWLCSVLQAVLRVYILDLQFKSVLTLIL